MSIALLATLWSCKSDPVEPAVTLKASSGTVDATGGTVSVTGNANVAWKVSVSGGDTSWVNVSPNSGTAGDFTITVTASANTTYSSRKVVVTVSADTASGSFTVEQAQNNALIVSGQTVTAAPRGEQISVDVSANVTVQASSNSSWLTVASGTKGLEKSIFVLNAQPNSTAKDRTATVSFSGQGVSESITVTQTYIPDITITPAQFEVSAEGGKVVCRVTATDQYTVTTDREWITESSSDNGQHTFTVDKSDIIELRSATITFTMADSVRVATVTQSAAAERFSISPSKVEVGAEQSTVEVTIDSNLEGFTVSIPESCTWVTQGEQDAQQPNTSLLKVAANTVATARQTTITYSSGSVGANLTIVQSADQKRLTVTPTVQLSPSQGGLFSVTVDANFDCQATVAQGEEWIHATKVEGTADNVFSFAVDANTLAKSRTGRIAFGDAQTEFASVDVTQAAANATLTVSPLLIELPVEGGEFGIAVEANFEYLVTVDSYEGWNVTKLSEKEGVITFSSDANTATVVRERTIVVSNSDGTVSQKVTLRQDARKYLTIDNASASIAAAGGSVEVNVESNVDYVVTNTADWIVVSNSGDRYTFTASANVTIEPRVAQIVFANAAQGLSTTLTINQFSAEKGIVVDPVLIELGAEDHSRVAVNVASNFDFDVTIPAADDWITIGQSTHLDAQTNTLFFSVAANRTYYSRSATITIGDSEKSVEVVFKQSQSNMLECLTPSISLELVGGEFDVTVKHNVDFECSVSADWLTLVSRTANADQMTTQLHFSAAANSGDTRDAVITFTDNGDLQATVGVVQYGGSITVGDANLMTCLLETIDTNHDGRISSSEAAAASQVDCSNRSVGSLTGLSQFPNLTKLNCSHNDLTTLDIAGLSLLTQIDCSYNAIPKFDFGAFGRLTELNISHNQLIALYLRTNYNLTSLDASYNKLTEITLSNNWSLEKALLGNNKLVLISLPKIDRPLKWLDLSNNQFEGNSYDELAQFGIDAALDLSLMNSDITHLDVTGNPYLKYIVLSDDTADEPYYDYVDKTGKIITVDQAATIIFTAVFSGGL